MSTPSAPGTPRARRQRPRPIRRCRVEGSAAGPRVLVVTVTTPRVKGEKVEVFRYWLTALPSDLGPAFRLDKLPECRVEGEPDTYDVLLAGQDSQCGCKGFLRYGMECNEGTGCRHIGSLTALHTAKRI